MSVPSYQSFLRPILDFSASGEEHHKHEIRDALITALELDAEDLAERIPSDRTTVFANRLGWALTYLFQAGLLDRPRRAVYRITDRGRTVSEQHPDGIDLKALQQFPEFREFTSPSNRGRGSGPEGFEATGDASTPVERIAAAHGELRAALAADLVERVMERSSDFFEQLVLDVLQGMGYGGGRTDSIDRLGQTSDAGVDGVIREDRLGLDQVYVQAKRWSNPVGRPEIQKFIGALTGKLAAKGVFITTSSFSSEAREYAEGITPRVVLVDGDELAQLMIEHQVGVSVEYTFPIEKVDLDYFLGGEDPDSS